jgi:outer membrane protein TolC
MASVGNFNKLQLAREQSFYAEAALQRARAEQLRRVTRERLARSLGVWGEQTAFRIPDRLPSLPASARELPDVERIALAQRLDLRALRLTVDELQSQRSVDQLSRWSGGLDLGIKRESSNEAPVKQGWELGIELPLFDLGDLRISRAEFLTRAALNRAADRAIQARSEVREAYGNYRIAWDIARHHREELVPLRQRIAEEHLLRYNGMLIGVFELLADARAQIAGVNAAIEALRDFWISEAELDAAMIGKPAQGLAVMAPSAPVHSGAEAGSGGH